MVGAVVDLVVVVVQVPDVPPVGSSSGCAVRSAVGGRGDADVPPDRLEGSPQVREERHPPSHPRQPPQEEEEWQVSEM